MWALSRSPVPGGVAKLPIRSSLDNDPSVLRSEQYQLRWNIRLDNAAHVALGSFVDKCHGS
jgi:hypothetical protein